MGIRKAVLEVVCFCLCLNGCAQAQKQKTDVEETRVSMTALRDAFVQSVKDAGFTCLIAVPPVMVEDVPSFGSYDPETNTLRTSAWSLLKPEESQMFYHFILPIAGWTSVPPVSGPFANAAGSRVVLWAQIAMPRLVHAGRA